MVYITAFFEFSVCWLIHLSGITLGYLINVHVRLLILTKIFLNFKCLLLFLMINIYLWLLRFILLVKRTQNTQYLPPNLSEKIFQLGLHASIFDHVRLFATVRLLDTREYSFAKIWKGRKSYLKKDSVNLKLLGTFCSIWQFFCRPYSVTKIWKGKKVLSRKIGKTWNCWGLFGLKHTVWKWYTYLNYV